MEVPKITAEIIRECREGICLPSREDKQAENPVCKDRMELYW